MRIVRQRIVVYRYSYSATFPILVSPSNGVGGSTVLSRCLGTCTALHWNGGGWIITRGLYYFDVGWLNGPPLLLHCCSKDPARKDVHNSTNTFLDARLLFIHRLIHDPRIRVTALYLPTWFLDSAYNNSPLRACDPTLRYQQHTGSGIGPYDTYLTPRVTFLVLPFLSMACYCTIIIIEAVYLVLTMSFRKPRIVNYSAWILDLVKWMGWRMAPEPVREAMAMIAASYG